MFTSRTHVSKGGDFFFPSRHTMDSCSAMRANWWTEKTWGCAELSDMLFLPGKAWRDLGRSEYATSVPSGALPTRPRVREERSFVVALLGLLYHGLL